MPHVFINRPRFHCVLDRTCSRADHRRWEFYNAVLYLAGGLVFIAGSILFFPALAPYENLGAWLFIIGSCIYLIVIVHDLLELITGRRQCHPAPGGIGLEATAVAAYLLGTLLFIFGSFLFLPHFDLIAAGAWCFIIGSLMFVVGAVINMVQIVAADSRAVLQLLNVTAVCFIVGSVLFAVASIPYLWHFDAPADERRLDGFLAGQYCLGSLLFFAGGISNYRRARLIGKRKP